MNNPKIKKHFSLFMVKKSIKKKSNESDAKHLLQETNSDPSQSIQKFIDPITCYHLSGDVYFIDKLYEQDIGLLSMNSNFKSITMLEYDAEHESWLVDLLSLNYPLDSWSLIYDRLMSLGDQHAYNLAQTIDDVILAKQKLSQNEEKMQTKQSKQKNNYLEEVEQLLQLKKNSIYFFCLYQMSSEKVLENKRIGFSKKLVELVFGSEYNFIDHLLRFGFFDFLTVEKDRYFDSINNNIRCLNSEDKFVSQKKFQTLDGQWCNVIPNVTTKIQFNEKGETTELFMLLELKPLNEDFFSVVQNKREEKTKFRKTKSNREINLENLLQFYYTDEESNVKIPNNTIENLKAVKGSSLNNRCGYRIIKNTIK